MDDAMQLARAVSRSFYDERTALLVDFLLRDRMYGLAPSAGSLLTHLHIDSRMTFLPSGCTSSSRT